ncbi:MAG TPA: hypothetical protein VK326_02765 [Solirubrobacterales bacterium]|nr:hypothetical protein [Solirubrobacterales bacterium]
MPAIRKVRVGSTGNDAELCETIPITKQRGRQRRVAMSFGSATRTDSPLPDLAPGDRLLVFAELEVTTDAEDAHHPGLIGKPYSYAPKVEARLLLAADDRQTEQRAGKAIALAPPWREAVSHLRHHGVVVFPKGTFTVPAAGLPWGGDHHVNLVLGADHPRAKQGDLLLVGQNEQTPVVGQDMAGIRVVRLRPGTQRLQKPARDSTCRVNGIPVAKRDTVVFSHRLAGLRQGEQLFVTAQLTTDASTLGYAARISSRLFLADADDQPEPGGGVAGAVSSWKGNLSKTTGFNCLPAEGPQTTRKFGVLRLTADPGQPLYLNLVAVSADPFGGASANDKLPIVRSRSFLDVTRFPPELEG